MLFVKIARIEFRNNRKFEEINSVKWKKLRIDPIRISKIQYKFIIKKCLNFIRKNRKGIKALKFENLGGFVAKFQYKRSVKVKDFIMWKDLINALSWIRVLEEINKECKNIFTFFFCK